MKFLALILAFSAVAIGAAVPDAASDKAAGVYICKDENWKGQCKHVAADNKCHGLEEDWKFAVSSIGPDPKVKCTFYLMPNCLLGVNPVGMYNTYTYPGKANLGDQWNDKFWSFQCY